MTPYEQIRDRAGADLGILRLNQQLQDQDKVRSESAYKEVYAQLKKEGLATWPYDENVPDEVVPYVVSLVAENCLATYGVSDKRYQRIKVEAARAMAEIRKNLAIDYVSEDPLPY